MPRALDLTGQRFGRLVALRRAGTKHGHVLWACRCDCSRECEVSANLLKRAHTQSCGCLRDEFLRLGPMAASVPCNTPWAGVSDYPVPKIMFPAKSAAFNEARYRHYQLKWAAIEMDIRRGQRTKSAEAKPTTLPMKPFEPKETVTVRTLPPMDEAELYGATSLRDCVRVVTG